MNTKPSLQARRQHEDRACIVGIPQIFGSEPAQVAHTIPRRHRQFVDILPGEDENRLGIGHRVHRLDGHPIAFPFFLPSDE